MNAPTLLIGLGGVGSKIVERVSGLITPEQRESIAVVVLDTDINDLRAIRKEIRLYGQFKHQPGKL